MKPGTEEYRELDEAQYRELQRSLLREKGGDLQREFLASLRENEDFVTYLEDRVEFRNGRELPIFDRALTASSFVYPTLDQETRMYDLWNDVSPRVASMVSFWAGVTLDHVRCGKISEASWLAANGGRTDSGEERIDRALSLSSDKGNREVDNCVRTVFRRMSGLPAARGNRSVFVNPTFGRGWWRERLVRRIFEREDVTEDRIALSEIVRKSPQYWENLVTMIVSRGSVFGSTDVQDALINTLAQHLAEHPDSPLGSATTLNIALRRFSNVAAARELGVLEFCEICEVVNELIVRIQRVYAA